MGGTALAVLLLFIAQSVLIGQLLLERRRRVNVQSAVQEQAAYEHMIAEITTEAVRHAPDEAPRALRNALARIARYADASTAVLVQYAETPTKPPMRLFWTGQAKETRHAIQRLDIPLVANGMTLGELILFRAFPDDGWPPYLVARVSAAGEVLAGAVARARAGLIIKQGEDLNRAVLASMSTQIAILDSRGTIIRVNEAWREVARRNFVDDAYDAFVGHNYVAECRRAEERGCKEVEPIRIGIQSVLDGRTDMFRHEYYCAVPDERWYELSVDSLERGEGGVVVTHLDITARRLAEIHAEETRRQVAHMARVGMLGELTATVSHELRQPLAAIRANAEAGALILSKPAPDLSEACQIFREIVQSDVRAAEVLENIRSLLRKEQPKTVAVDLNEVCRHAGQLLRGDAALRRVQFDVDLEPHLPPTSGDPVQLQQVVLNLTMNAIDASAARDGARTVQLMTRVNNGAVEVVVQDSGPGLSEDVQEHLFEAFFTTKQHGLGMGLVIVRSIVERHRGRILADNTPDGATFTVRLPRLND